MVKRIEIQLGHVLRMDSSNPVREVFESDPGGGSRIKGRPKQMDENVTTLGIRRQAAVARDVCRQRPRPVTGCNGQISK